MAVAWTAIGILAAFLAAALGLLATALFQLGARIDALGSSLGARIDTQGAELRTVIAAQSARIDRLETGVAENTVALGRLSTQIQAHLGRHTG